MRRRKGGILIILLRYVHVYCEVSPLASTQVLSPSMFDFLQMMMVQCTSGDNDGVSSKRNASDGANREYDGKSQRSRVASRHARNHGSVPERNGKNERELRGEC